MDESIKIILSYAKWRQKIHINGSISTTGRVNIDLWNKLRFETEIKDKHFLDIGANDGLFSFYAEKNGALTVTASDVYFDEANDMNNGWDPSGIELLKKYFNSNILIHRNGIYHVQELNKKFNTILVNHVINWLPDIENAIKCLSDVVSKDAEVIIHDGFLLPNHPNEFIEPKNMPIKRLYKTSFIADILRKNGFKISSVNEINYQEIFIHDFLHYPKVNANKKVKLYKAPLSDSDFTLVDSLNDLSYTQYGDFIHVFQKGWVMKKDVDIVYNKKTAAYLVFEKLGLLGLFFTIKNQLFKYKNKYSYYTIKAIKQN